MERIENQLLQREGEKPILVDIFHLPDAKPKPFIVFSHGFKGYKDWGAFDLMADFFASRGFIFVKFNFSHNGGTPEQPIDFPDLESFARNTYSKELADLDFMVDWLAAQTLIDAAEQDLDAIYLMGHSRGGAISLLQAAYKSEVKKLVTLGAVSDFASHFPQGKAFETWKRQGRGYVSNTRTGQQLPMDFGFYEDFLEHRERFDLERAAKALHKPFLIVHGTDDQAVAPSEAHDLHRWAPHSELYLIPGASHAFGAVQPWDRPQLPDDLHKALDRAARFFKGA